MQISDSLNRRSLLRALALAPAWARGLAAAGELPPIQALTTGPKFHWFGYYDKLEFDPTSRYVLGNEVDFEGRTPTGDDVIRLGMIDLASGNQWIELGQSRAWSWQQGCMFQWLPGSKSEVIWNDREGDRYVSHVLDVKTRKRRTLPGPIYALSPDGKWALTPDFRRIHDTRPGYGYAGLPDPNVKVNAPKDAGIWRMNLTTGDIKLVVPFAACAGIAYKGESIVNYKHWYNHVLFSTDGARFSFLHRWSRREGNSSFTTRLFTAKPDGTDLYDLDPHGLTSHYIWRDPNHILAWAYHPSHGEKFYLYQDRSDKVEVVGPDVMVVNGHCTYLPGNQWILNDTYPDANGNQNPYLYRVETGKRYPLGHLHVPSGRYNGEFRCDLHPRFSPDGRKVVVDSTHGGNGRQMYLIDIRGIVAKA